MLYSKRMSEHVAPPPPEFTPENLAVMPPYVLADLMLKACIQPVELISAQKLVTKTFKAVLPPFDVAAEALEILTYDPRVDPVRPVRVQEAGSRYAIFGMVKVVQTPRGGAAYNALASAMQAVLHQLDTPNQSFLRAELRQQALALLNPEAMYTISKSQTEGILDTLIYTSNDLLHAVTPDHERISTTKEYVAPDCRPKLNFRFRAPREYETKAFFGTPHDLASQAAKVLSEGLFTRPKDVLQVAQDPSLPAAFQRDTLKAFEAQERVNRLDTSAGLLYRMEQPASRSTLYKNLATLFDAYIERLRGDQPVHLTEGDLWDSFLAYADRYDFKPPAHINSEATLLGLSAAHSAVLLGRWKWRSERTLTILPHTGDERLPAPEPVLELPRTAWVSLVRPVPGSEVEAPPAPPAAESQLGKLREELGLAEARATALEAALERFVERYIDDGTVTVPWRFAHDRIGALAGELSEPERAYIDAALQEHEKFEKSPEYPKRPDDPDEQLRVVQPDTAPTGIRRGQTIKLSDKPIFVKGGSSTVDKRNSHRLKDMSVPVTPDET